VVDVFTAFSFFRMRVSNRRLILKLTKSSQNLLVERLRQQEVSHPQRQ
jgi:hypothetical protein